MSAVQCLITTLSLMLLFVIQNGVSGKNVENCHRFLHQNVSTCLEYSAVSERCTKSINAGSVLRVMGCTSAGRGGTQEESSTAF